MSKLNWNQSLPLETFKQTCIRKVLKILGVLSQVVAWNEGAFKFHKVHYWKQWKLTQRNGCSCFQQNLLIASDQYTSQFPLLLFYFIFLSVAIGNVLVRITNKADTSCCCFIEHKYIVDFSVCQNVSNIYKHSNSWGRDFHPASAKWNSN